EEPFLLRLGEAQPVVCPLAERSFEGSRDVFSPFGFAGFVASVGTTWPGKSWVKFAATNRLTTAYVRLHPVLTPNEWPIRFSVTSTRTIYIWDLSRTESSMLSRMSARRRSDLSRGLGAAELVTSPFEVAEFFIREYPEFARKKQLTDAFDLG